MTEMLRDPLSYIFCLGFPVIMLILFYVINRNTGGATPVFEMASLLPGILMFSFTFMMLFGSLLLSTDRQSAFLLRLYTSPMRTWEFLAGYLCPLFLLGIAQEIVCVVAGWVLTLIGGGNFLPFGKVMLLCLWMLPMLLSFLLLGLLFGTLLNEKSAPGVCSIFISAAGVLGGCWMPLDTMGGFETFCRVLPFYPAVYIGRIITGATHTVGGAYTFDTVAKLGLIPLILTLLLTATLASVAFSRMAMSDRK